MSGLVSLLPSTPAPSTTCTGALCVCVCAFVSMQYIQNGNRRNKKESEGKEGGREGGREGDRKNESQKGRENRKDVLLTGLALLLLGGRGGGGGSSLEMYKGCTSLSSNV